MTPRARTLLWSATRHFLLLAGALVMLTPFIWMISTASKPQTEIFSSDLHLIPYHFALWDNLRPVGIDNRAAPRLRRRCW